MELHHLSLFRNRITTYSISILNIHLKYSTSCAIKILYIWLTQFVVYLHWPRTEAINREYPRKWFISKNVDTEIRTQINCIVFTTVLLLRRTPASSSSWCYLVAPVYHSLSCQHFISFQRTYFCDAIGIRTQTTHPLCGHSAVKLFHLNKYPRFIFAVDSTLLSAYPELVCGLATIFQSI